MKDKYEIYYDNINLIKALQVSFLKQKWEFILYAKVLKESESWGNNVK